MPKVFSNICILHYRKKNHFEILLACWILCNSPLKYTQIHTERKRNKFISEPGLKNFLHLIVLVFIPLLAFHLQLVITFIYYFIPYLNSKRTRVSFFLSYITSKRHCHCYLQLNETIVMKFKEQCTRNQDTEVSLSVLHQPNYSTTEHTLTPGFICSLLK